MSSGLLIAGARCVEDKKTLYKFAAYRKIEISKNHHFANDWILKIIIGLGELTDFNSTSA